MSEQQRTAILDRLAAGESLNAICKADGMPDRRTVQRWQEDDTGFDAAVTHAREVGFHSMAEEALREATACTDPQKGRLAFDARRWYLGKLSNAFSDNKPQAHKHEHDLSDKAKEWLGQTL